MEIYICIGSSCHLKGSYDIIAIFKKLIAEHGLEDRVKLNASFCLGQCQNGVTGKINNELITGLTAEGVQAIFEEKVLKVLQ